MMDEQQKIEFFFEIHKDLTREGPGCFEATKQAFSMLSELPEKPYILDIGCGPGRQTLDLTKLTHGSIVAVDKHQPFLDRLQELVIENKLSHRIEINHGDMSNLPYEVGSFDLIWAEGSIFIIGFESGLRRWKPLLKTDGYIAATEVTWIKKNAPREARDFWNACYPAIQDTQSNLKIIKRCGYRPIGYFILPKSAWWDDYYRPLEKRLMMLRERYINNTEVLRILDEEWKEIDIFRKYSDYYGYVFYVMQVQR